MRLPLDMPAAEVRASLSALPVAYCPRCNAHRSEVTLFDQGIALNGDRVVPAYLGNVARALAVLAQRGVGTCDDCKVPMLPLSLSATA